jgi:hypothetical protein
MSRTLALYAILGIAVLAFAFQVLLRYQYVETYGANLGRSTLEVYVDSGPPLPATLPTLPTPLPCYSGPVTRHH